jgi:cation diffusion facilitator CzcD-associated flavoprotein CzcO
MLTFSVGFGGLLFAGRLLQSGFLGATEILFVDTAGGFGGTWWWIQYTGLTCDAELHIHALVGENRVYAVAGICVWARVEYQAERIAN